MAIKLNQGADAALVTAATRAGLAATPQDYGDALDSAAESYQKSIEASNQIWKDIGTIAGVIGKDMVENAQEFMSYKIKGGALNPDSAKFLVNELEENKKAQREIGIFGGILGNSETRQKKAELKIKQNELFAEIDAAAESINAGAEAVANDLYDHNLDLENGEMINAIIKSNLRDEKTGELMFSLLDSNGNPAMGSDGKQKTMTMKEFNKSIKTNIKDVNNAMGKSLNTLNNSRATAGNKSKDGVYDEQMKQMDLNSMDAMLNTPTDLKRAMRTTFGYSNTSFYDDIKQPSTLSEDLYITLLKATGNEGMLSADGTNTGVLEGVKDLDGDGNISKAELQNAENYTVLSANILNLKDPEVSKAYFKEYTIDKLEKAFEYGYSKREKKGSGEGDKDKTGGHVGSSMAGVGWVPGEKKKEYRGYIDKFADFQGNYGNWVFDKDEGKYYDSDAKEKVFISAYDVAQKEDAAKGDPAEDFFYSPDSKTQVELNEEQAKGLATWDMLNFESDNDAADELNDWFGFGNSSSVKFVPYYGGAWKSGLSGWVMQDDQYDNSIMMVDPVSGEPYTDKSGNIYEFNIDGNQNTLQGVIDSINSNPIISPFVKPRTKPTP